MTRPGDEGTLISQIANTDPHMMQQTIRHGHGNGQAKKGVHSGDGIDAAIEPEHGAKEKGGDERKRGQQRTGQVGHGEQRGRHPDGGASAKQVLGPGEEK